MFWNRYEVVPDFFRLKLAESRRYCLYAVILYLILFACKTGYAQELVLISPHWEGIRYEFENGFNKWRRKNNLPQVRFVWKQVGGASEILRFVQSEFQGKPAGIGVDLIFGGGIDPFESLKKENLLQSFSPQVLPEIPGQISGVNLYDPDLKWFAPTISAFGIFCNHKVLDILKLENPQSWEDLIKPGYRSWIASADPRKSGSAHMYYEIILQSYGWQKGWQILFDMAANFRTFLSGSSQVGLDVASGEVACGFFLDSQAKVQMMKYPAGQFSFIVPKGRSLFSGDAMAILKGAQNAEIAGQFIEYSLSSEAQKLWYLPAGHESGPEKYSLNKLPIYPELFKDPLISEYDPFKTNEENTGFIFSNSLSSARWEILNDLLGIFLIESFDYGSLQNADCRKQLPAESEIKKLIDEKAWNDPVLKNRIISSWRDSISGCSNHSFKVNLPFFAVLAILLLFGIKKYRE